MSITTGTMGLTLLAESQSQKFLTVNNALQAIDTKITIMGSPALSALPTSVQQLPIAASIAGKPAAASKVWIVPITHTVIIPANLAGSIGYADTVATANATFGLSYRDSGGTLTTLATMVFATGSHNATLSTQASATLTTGGILMMATPTVQDTTLADVGITLLTSKT